MNHLRPSTLDELVQVRAAHPDWLIAAGSTDVMVPINFGRSRPAGIIDVTQVEGLASVQEIPGGIRLGAGVTFARIEKELGRTMPALAVAARAVASPQIRARATLGGNLGTASPAGDAHPFLLASDAQVELRSARGARHVPCTEFFLGPGRSVLGDDEVIAAIDVPVPSDTSQGFSKIGPRNAMVIAVASLALVVDWTAHRVGVGLGSVGPTPLRAAAAEEFLSQLISAEAPGGPGVRREEIERFAGLVAEAARPIDDVRGTADYRRHTVRLMARRCLTWALHERGKLVAA